jgi:tetratricopeptide (TPR) repeat protein
MSGRRLLRSCLPLLLAAAAAAQVPLAEVAKLARERAERSRPAQMKALEPFWPDLALNYDDNREVLAARIAEVANLGDSVVPVLLEKLTPGAGGGDTARQLAANCRRVLERLDPASFVDALAELANGGDATARGEAIRLLGAAQNPKATALLVELLDTAAGDERRAVLRSLRQHRAPAGAGKAATLLGANDRGMREDVLYYLTAARAGSVAGVVADALAVERDPKLLPLYVEYFAASTKANEAAARALLPLLDRDRLDWQDTRRLVQILAVVAPPGHEPTTRRLAAMLDDGEPSSVSVQVAVTMRALGDKQGVTRLRKSIDELMRKGRRRQEGALYEHRANLSFAIEDYAEAFADFEKVLEFQDGLAMTRRAYVGMLRCDAQRKRTASFVKLMRASGMTVAEIEALGADDPAFAETLKQDRVRQSLLALAKEQAPK